MTIAVLTDIHLGTDLQLTPEEGPLRAASSLVESRLTTLLQSIKEKHQPNYWFDLGDVLRSESVEVDQVHYRRGLELLHEVCQPIIHLLGNHEVRALSKEQVTNIWRETGYQRDEYGSEIIDGIKFLWLGIGSQTVGEHTLSVLPDDQLRWLETELQAGTEPVIILSHYAYNQQDMGGNFYWEALGKNFSCYDNQKQIREVVYRFADRVKCTINGHVHWIQTQLSSPVPHLTLPSLIENIAAPGERVFPGIYSLVTIDGNRTMIKSYAGEWCFASLEL